MFNEGKSTNLNVIVKIRRKDLSHLYWKNR